MNEGLTGLERHEGEQINNRIFIFTFTHLHLHLVILRMLLSKSTYNWGIHKVIHPKEADRHRKCSQYQVSGIVPNNYKLEREGINKEFF